MGKRNLGFNRQTDRQTDRQVHYDVMKESSCHIGSSWSCYLL